MERKRERAIDKYTKTGRNCYWIRSTTAAMQQKKSFTYNCNRIFFMAFHRTHPFSLFVHPSALSAYPCFPNSESDKRFAIVQWTPKVKSKLRKKS